MAKPKKQIKRTVSKAGEVRYFYGGKRVSDKKGRSMYVRKGYSDFLPQSRGEKPKPFTPKLTKTELRTLQQIKAQRSLDRFHGRPVPKFISHFFRKVMKDFPESQEGIDFAKLKDGKGNPVYKRYSDIIREVDKGFEALTYTVETAQGLPWFRGRENITSITDIVERFSEPGFSNAKFWVRLPEYMPQPHDISGRNLVFEAIRNWEVLVIESVMEARQNVAYVKFDYHPKIDWKENMVIFDLRLKPGEIADHARDYADLKHEGVIIQVMTSDPIKRTS